MTEEYLLGVISNIEAEKRGKIHPDFALREEIMSHIYDDMRKTLGTLLKSNKIKYHKTISSWAVETTPDKPTGQAKHG